MGAFSPELTMNTPNRPRSGIVPPEVTASRCAPGRPVIRPFTRSQTMRGRNSANSSDGYRPLSRSRVASYAERGRDANGALRRTVSYQSSTSSESRATAATVCWARMSSGFCGIAMASISPAVIRSLATAEWMRSARCFGKMMPRDTSPTWWPARPMRCRPLATEGGDSTWITRSTAPMSMPSSRDEVATTQRNRPVLRSSSMMARWSFDTEPWCARASNPAEPWVWPEAPIIAAGGRLSGSSLSRPPEELPAGEVSTSSTRDS